MSSPTLSSEADFNYLLDIYCSKLSSEGLETLHHFSQQSGLLPLEPEPEGCSHAGYILRSFAQSLLNRDNLQLLKYVARASGQTDLLQIVETFERGLPFIIEPLPRDSENTASHIHGYTPVNVILRQKANNMNRDNIQSLCMFLVDVCGIQYHQLACVGYKLGDKEGTVELMVTVPSECVPKLEGRLNAAGDKALEEIGILGIELPADNAANSGKNEIPDPVEDLLKRIRNGEAPSPNDVKAVLGQSLGEDSLDSLLFCAIRCSNADALYELGTLLTSQGEIHPNQTIIDLIQKKGFKIGAKLLVNAFIAGREDMVRSLLNYGLILHPVVEAYTVLLATVCQKDNYPASLLECLLEQEKTIQRPFQDRDRNEVYETCVKYCCVNDRDDLVKVFINHFGNIPVDDANCSSCIGRAMSRIGSQYYLARVSPDSDNTVKCGIVSWANFGLTHLSGEWLTRANLGALLVKLDVSSNKLSSIPFNVLDGTLPRLEEVDCSHNKLRSLWSDEASISTRNKFRLKVINASNNEMEQISLHVFQIPSLEVINVSYNILSSLPGPGTLLETDGDSSEGTRRYWLCTQLKVLDASHNKLTRLPETFEEVLHLRKLNVCGNLLDRLPWTLCRARFLEQVDLSCNDFGSSEDTYHVMVCIPKYVQTLQISNNKLDEIPLSLAAMTSLRLLDCSKNKIASLPKKEEWSLPHLESFLASENELGGKDEELELPDSFSKSLTHLDLRHNQLKKFPKAILALKQIVYLELEGNPGIKKLPPELATLKRLWELKIDKMEECVRDFDPSANLGTERIHFSRIKKNIQNIFYGYDSYCGVKLTVNGSEAARDSVIRGLNLQAGTLVSNLILSSRLGVRTGRLRARTKSEVTTATFKVWNIPDVKSFVVLQHAFFSNNTVHLLVWHESDGLPGLDGLSEKLQLIRTKDSVLPILVVLTTKLVPQETQSRIDEFAKYPGFKREAIKAVVQIQKGGISLLPLREELRKVAENLTTVSHSYKGEPRNWVPSACREAANKLFSAQPPITTAVCGRKSIEDKLFPAGLTDPDDFGQAMNFLIRIGGLLHFEDTTQNLYEYFYVNLDLISQIVVALTAARSGHLSSGVAHSRHIHAVFKQLSVSESDSDAFLALLIKLGVAVPLDSCHSRFLLPFRLPSERSGLKLTLSHYLSPSDADSTSTGPTYVRRLYAIDGSPRSFWGQFISALVLEIQSTLGARESPAGRHHKSNSIFWASGIISLYEDGCFAVNVVMKDGSMAEYTKPIEKTKQCVENGLDIIVFDRRRRFAALGWICSHVERLLNEWNIVTDGQTPSFIGDALLVQRLVPYPAFHLEQTDDDTLNDFIFEHAIPETAELLHLEDCVLSTVERSVITTPEGHTVDASQLAPDFTLKSLLPSERLREEDVIIDTTSRRKLGIGGFATVLLGYYRNEKVAIKTFGNLSLLESEETMEFKSDQFASTSDKPIWPQQTKYVSLKEMGYHALSLSSSKTPHSEDNTKGVHSRPSLIRKPSCSFNQLHSLVQEVSVMTQLTHKNIAQFRGVIFHPCPCLVMEFAPGGDLAGLIDRRRDRLGPIDKLLNGEHFSTVAHNGILGRKLTYRIAFQVALAIEYLHSKSICHLDIKPENVLVWSESLSAPVNVKLADYGISRTVTAGGLNNECGTPGYQAPEQILSRKSRGESFDLRVDIFAYGIMMYFVLTGIHPFHKDMKDLFTVEQKVRMNDRPTLPTGQSLVYLQTLIDRCWRYWPSERPSAGQIVGEMCEPTFHVQCEDLLLSGKHQILATSVMEDNSGRAHLESFDDSDSSHRSQTMTSNELGESDQSEILSTSSRSEEPRTPSPCGAPNEKTSAQNIAGSSISLESELLGKFEELRRGSFGFASTPPHGQEKRASEDRNQYPGDDHKAGNSKRPAPRESPEDERQVALFEGYLQPSFFALVATSDSVLVASPRFSEFLFAQKLNIREGDVSALMFLNNRLWIGLRSELRCGQSAGLLYVYECSEGEIGRRTKNQTFSCNDVIEDIQCQFSSDRQHAAVFAILANGEIMVVHGEAGSTAKKDNTSWGEDEIYNWNYPEVRKIGKVGLDEEEAAHVISRIVVTKPRELWYCQGNSILALDTQKPTEREPFKVIPVRGFSNSAVSIHGIKIKDAVHLGDTVWCSSCQDFSQNVLQAVDVASRRPSGRWTLEELLQCATQPVTEKDRAQHSDRLASVPPKSVQCLAPVCDTLWVGCDNGAILVLHKKSREGPPRLLATLWCRTVFNHALSNKGNELPLVVIREMKQIGDRVLVYFATHPNNDNSVQQTTVAEVYLALSSSQIEELNAQYNVQLV